MKNHRRHRTSATGFSDSPSGSKVLSGTAAWLYGWHAVNAAWANPARVIRRLVASPEMADQLASVSARQQTNGPQPSRPPLDRPPLDRQNRPEIDRLLPPGSVHQGIAALTEPLADLDIEDLIDQAPGDALVVVLDQITDPHNVGAIWRSAAAFGAHAVMLPERHSPQAAGVVAKAASGALELVPAVRPVNLARALRQLRDAQFWCVGLAGEAPTELNKACRPGRVALVLGAEGDGLRRLTRETCDELARLPTDPAFPSLNVSNAAAVALHIARSVAGSAR